VEIVARRHNLVITGQAGTGKTRMMKAIMSDLANWDTKYALLCTTGIACLQYDYDQQASTIHRCDILLFIMPSNFIEYHFPHFAEVGLQISAHK